MSPLLSTLASAAEGAAKAASHEPSGLSTLGGIIALVVTAVGLIAVGGAAIMMMVGAINGRRQLVTSWSMEQEATFTPYEQRSQAAQSKAWMAGLVSAAAVAVISIGVYLGVKPDMRDQEKAAKSMNMSNLTKKGDAAAPAATPAKSDAAPAEKKEAPKAEEKTDEAPAADEEKKAE